MGDSFFSYINFLMLVIGIISSAHTFKFSYSKHFIALFFLIEIMFLSFSSHLNLNSLFLFILGIFCTNVFFEHGVSIDNYFCKILHFMNFLNLIFLSHQYEFFLFYAFSLMLGLLMNVSYLRSIYVLGVHATLADIFFIAINVLTVIVFAHDLPLYDGSLDLLSYTCGILLGYCFRTIFRLIF